MIVNVVTVVLSNQNVHNEWIKLIRSLTMRKKDTTKDKDNFSLFI